MILTGSFAGEYEIINAAGLLNISIVIYTNLNYSDSDDLFEFEFENLYTKNNTIFNPFIPTILIGWVNRNHFVLIMPKGISPKELPIEANLNTSNNKNNTNIKICNSQQKQKINNLKNAHNKL